MTKPQVVLLDIEGTTTSIAFVKDRLFPFAEAALDGFLAAHGGRPEVQAILAEVPGPDRAATLRGWMAADAKVTPLKALQGLIWAEGYADGQIQGHLWPDVAAALRAWHAAGVRLAIYSSGSVAAQRDLFGHSEAGDLTPLLDGFFDTRVGGKREPASYAAIARALGVVPDAVLFLSDIAEELDAAVAAGMRVCQLVRPADGTVASLRHPAAADFPGVAGQFGLG